MSTTPDVSVVIVSFNTRDLLRECITTLKRHSGGLTVETVVVDNASRDGSADMVAAEFPEARLIRSDANLGFGNANNRGFERCTGRYVVLLNSDAFLREGALERAVGHMQATPAAGLGGALLVGRDDAWQPSARRFPSLWLELVNLSGLAARYPASRVFGALDRTWADPQQAARVDWVPGAFSIVPRDLLERVGSFDPAFFLYYEEVDLCRRIKRAGREVWYWPDIVVTHLGGESSKTVTHLDFTGKGAQLVLWRMRSQLLYYRKWHGPKAWLVMRQEQLWHRLRARKNRRRDEAKARESRVLVELWDQAWRETRGGRVSPPQPW